MIQSSLTKKSNLKKNKNIIYIKEKMLNFIFKQMQTNKKVFKNNI